MRIWGIVILLALFSFGIVVMRIEINRSGRAISQEQNEVEIKEARNQYLKLEILRLSSPENISRLAREKLGLVPVQPHEVVVLDHSK
ncbi:MAG: septum formation initiator family protein [Candidatus Avelusimicrobium sp.]|uniref:septum formation initiator family protein n=1 Tax=Candidatus Avelusimicrobium sp. TaxID=3048833 RepID=UPI003EFFFBE3